MNLGTQRKKYQLIIGADYLGCSDYFEKIKNVIQYGFSYFTILHDCDTNDDGTPKNNHYHLILTNDKKVRASTVLKMLCDLLHCKAENIQILICSNFTASLKYIVHITEPDKYQYDRNLIYSNHSKTYINSILDSANYDLELTTETLFDIICNSNGDIISIIKCIGISSYAYYRNTINDILKSIK